MVGDAIHLHRDFVIWEGEVKNERKEQGELSGKVNSLSQPLAF